VDSLISHYDLARMAKIVGDSIIQNRDHVEPSLRASIPEHPSILDQWNNTRLDSWLTLYKQEILFSIDTFARRCIRGIRPITAFFTRHRARNQNVYFQDINAPPWKGAEPPSNPLHSESGEAQYSP